MDTHTVTFIGMNYTVIESETKWLIKRTGLKLEVIFEAPKSEFSSIEELLNHFQEVINEQ